MKLVSAVKGLVKVVAPHLRLPSKNNAYKAPDAAIWSNHFTSAEGSLQIDAFGDLRLTETIILPNIEALRGAVDQANKYARWDVEIDHFRDYPVEYIEAAKAATHVLKGLQDGTKISASLKIASRVVRDSSFSSYKQAESNAAALSTMSGLFDDLDFGVIDSTLARALAAHNQPLKRGNPGKSYKKAFLRCLAFDWLKWTGALPSETYSGIDPVPPSPSPRPHFRPFAQAALNDVGWKTVQKAADDVTYMMKILVPEINDFIWSAEAQATKNNAIIEGDLIT